VAAPRADGCLTMAGDWIKMRADLQTHPKAVRIASAIGADRLRAVGGLHAVWCLFDAHSIDGSLDGYTAEALDSLIGCPGFAHAMAAVGWLQVSDCSLSLPRFDEHNGRSAKRRATETERKREARKAADDPHDARDMSASHADGMRTREEKRREDISTPVGVEKAPRQKRAPPPPAPPGVADQTWADWLDLRRKKRAPVTATVIDAATSEASKAGMTLDAFLRVWCFRGSQGLQADWIKPEDRARFGHGQPLAKGAAIEAHNNAVAQRYLDQFDQQQQEIDA